MSQVLPQAAIFVFSQKPNCHIKFGLFNYLLSLFKLIVYNSSKLLGDIIKVKKIEKVEACKSQMKINWYKAK